MDDKPNIQTAVKDYSGKKVSIIKLDIILTLVLLLVSGFMFYSLYPKIKNSHYMGNLKVDDNDVSTTTTTVSNDDNIDVVELSSDNYVVYKVTNQTGRTKDITIRLNTYVNNSIDNTLSYQANAINNNSVFYAYFKKSDLKIYDKYEYIINSSNSIYSSATDSIKLSTLDYDQHKYIITNDSGITLNDIDVIIIYYNSNKEIVDIEEMFKPLLDNGKNFEISVKKDYSYFDVFLNEAYYLKKES